jgi:hypothetical protein
MSSSVAYPEFAREQQTFRDNYSQSEGSIKQQADGKRIAEGMQTFFTYLSTLPQDDKPALTRRLYEVNTILRHPSIKNKANVFATITDSLAGANKDLSYGNLAGNLNDVTVGYMNTVLAAERAAGAVINEIWPPARAHSSLVPFRVMTI